MILNDLDRVLMSFDGNPLKEAVEGGEKDLTLRSLLRTTLLTDSQPQDNKVIRIERYKLAKHVLTADQSVELTNTQIEMIINRLEKFVNTLCLGTVQEILKPDLIRLN